MRNQRKLHMSLAITSAMMLASGTPIGAELYRQAAMQTPPGPPEGRGPSKKKNKRKAERQARRRNRK